MEIRPTKFSINLLFGGFSEQFVVPAYQRRYSWEHKQLNELFEDILNIDKETSHLLGSILFLTGIHEPELNRLELVDGQQRITTIAILLKAIRDRYQELDDEETAKEIDSFLFCKGIDRKLQNKVLLGDLDNPDYVKVMKREDLEAVKNEKLSSAYEHYYWRLKDLDLEDLHKFYFRLMNNVVVIRLDVSQATDAYRLFETMNNRGLNLSPTDIIKNFLLGHASLVSKETLEKVKDNWKGVIVNLDRIDTDNFFRQYMAGVLKNKVTKNKLIDVFKRYYLENIEESEEPTEPEEELDNECPTCEKPIPIYESPCRHCKTELDWGEELEKVSIIDFSKLLLESSDVYSKIVNRNFKNNDINRHLHNLQRIQSIPSYIFLLNLFQRDVDDKERIGILKLIETFMLRRHVCKYQTGELDQIFASLVGFDDEEIVDNVKRELSRHLPNNEEFETHFKEHDYKGNSERAKYVLEQIGYYLMEDQGELVFKSGKDVHLEHIIPQKIDTKKSKKFGDWEEYLGKNAKENHKELANTIGNLTLLGGSLNIVASNNPFKAKLEEYKKSNINLTERIAENYVEFKFPDVENRSAELAEIALQIWNLGHPHS